VDDPGRQRSGRAPAVASGVTVHGEASANLPILPWVAGGLLVAATAWGLTGEWVLVRAIRPKDEPVAVAPDESQRLATARAPRSFQLTRRRGATHLGSAAAQEVNGVTHATTSTEKIDVQGGHLVAKAKALIHEGNVRRIIIKDAGGKTAMEVPVTVGVAGFFAAPVMAAVGALAALAADYSIEVERGSSRVHTAG
jgi:Domain of unknown function (DUF4342)